MNHSTLGRAVRDENRLYGKNGSLEDILPFQKETNHDSRNYEETEGDVMSNHREYSEEVTEEEGVLPESNTEEPSVDEENADEEHEAAMYAIYARYADKSKQMMIRKYGEKLNMRIKMNINSLQKGVE